MSGGDDSASGKKNSGAEADEAKVISLQARKRQGRSCPICSKPEVQAYRPFCSAHCKNVDLNRWLGERYRIPTEEAPDSLPAGGHEDDDDPGPQSA
ncbi:DNA gyrase inhibitor YacG [Fodinicurvata sediminis]|uniref:DNA gyrase inhibitor YacG n=1 Tax=Fodinicurvata sediminis TaxID=1121832 RepID=UPI0003B6FBAC|nr:DNA gyrase inhibitor YacG [Fodinicurvata sediminis]